MNERAKPALEASPNSRTEAITDEMIEAGSRVLCRAYQIDDGFSEKQADRHAASEMGLNFRREARDCYTAMQAARPIDQQEGYTVSGATYEAAVKGRQDFRNAYRKLLPILRAAEALSVKWRTKGQKADSNDFYGAVNAVDATVAEYYGVPAAKSAELLAKIGRAETPYEPDGSDAPIRETPEPDPIAPVQDDDAEWLREHIEHCRRMEYTKEAQILERIANRLGNQSVGGKE